MAKKIIKRIKRVSSQAVPVDQVTRPVRRVPVKRKVAVLGSLPLGGRPVRPPNGHKLYINVNPSWEHRSYAMSKFSMGWAFNVYCTLYTDKDGVLVLLKDDSLDVDNNVVLNSCTYTSKRVAAFPWRKTTNGEAMMLDTEITIEGQQRLADYLNQVRLDVLQKMSPELLQKVIDGKA